MECLFCRIIRREIPSELIYEDDHSVAFLDVSPRTPGHTMVIPKEHSPSLVELSAPEVGPLFEAVQKVAAKVAGAVGADGLTIGMNQGDASGQTVKHLHVHILPRFQKDRGGSLHSVVDNPPQESLSEIAEKIRNQK